MSNANGPPFSPFAILTARLIVTGVSGRGATNTLEWDCVIRLIPPSIAFCAQFRVDAQKTWLGVGTLLNRGDVIVVQLKGETAIILTGGLMIINILKRWNQSNSLQQHTMHPILEDLITSIFPNNDKHNGNVEPKGHKSVDRVVATQYFNLWGPLRECGLEKVGSREAARKLEGWNGTILRWNDIWFPFSSWPSCISAIRCHGKRSVLLAKTPVRWPILVGNIRKRGPRLRVLVKH